MALRGSQNSAAPKVGTELDFYIDITVGHHAGGGSLQSALKNRVDSSKDHIRPKDEHQKSERLTVA